MEPEFHPLAIDEARAARLWYQIRSLIASERFIAELDAAIDSIVENPRRFPEYIHRTRRHVFHRFPFSVVFAIRSDHVFIVAVAHAKRKPGYWRQRL